MPSGRKKEKKTKTKPEHHNASVSSIDIPSDASYHLSLAVHGSSFSFAPPDLVRPKEDVGLIPVLRKPLLRGIDRSVGSQIGPRLPTNDSGHTAGAVSTMRRKKLKFDLPPRA